MRHALCFPKSFTISKGCEKFVLAKYLIFAYYERLQANHLKLVLTYSSHFLASSVPSFLIKKQEYLFYLFLRKSDVHILYKNLRTESKKSRTIYLKPMNKTAPTNADAQSPSDQGADDEKNCEPRESLNEEAPDQDDDVSILDTGACLINFESARSSPKMQQADEKSETLSIDLSKCTQDSTFGHRTLTDDALSGLLNFIHSSCSPADIIRLKEMLDDRPIDVCACVRDVGEKLFALPRSESTDSR